MSLDRFHVNNFWGGWEVAGANFGLMESHIRVIARESGDPVTLAMLQGTGFPLSPE